MIRLPNCFRGYAWVLYLALAALLVYYFRVPLRAYEKVESRKHQCGGSS